jgi:single-strand DNA-binding protein
MAGVNKAIIVGNLGRDPEVSYSQSGMAVCRLAVATSEKWKDQSGQMQEKTEWHNITVFGKMAENCEKYLAKGRQVYIEGRIQTDKYEKDGIDRYSTKIIASTVQFLSSGNSGGGQGGYQQPAQPRQQPQQKYQQPNQGYQQPQGGMPDESDIPF